MKSSSTALWHRGHLGSSRDSITYIMHRGHPARTMGAAPPTTGGAAASGLPSDDTHELGGDAVDEDEEDTRRGDVVLPLFRLSPPGRTVVEGPPLAPDRPILRNSSFDALPLFLLIFTAAHN